MGAWGLLFCGICRLFYLISIELFLIVSKKYFPKNFSIPIIFAYLRLNINDLSNGRVFDL